MTVADMEGYFRDVHKAFVHSPACGFDVWFDNHYGIDMCGDGNCYEHDDDAHRSNDGNSDYGCDGSNYIDDDGNDVYIRCCGDGDDWGEKRYVNDDNYDGHDDRDDYGCYYREEYSDDDRDRD